MSVLMVYDQINEVNNYIRGSAWGAGLKVPERCFWEKGFTEVVNDVA